ncbi:hypothetical protein ACES2L_06670 [Bdellovibrio bacteriovorus]
MNFKTSLLIASLCFWSFSSFAASVNAVKGQKVLIDLQGDEVTEGDEFYLINTASKKRTGIIRIKQVKGNKALAEILKGKAASGFTLQAKAPSQMSADPADESSPEERPSRDTSFHRTLKDAFGVLGSYHLNSMDAEVSSTVLGIPVTASAAMVGNGFGLAGFYDYVFARDFIGRGIAAIEQFNVAGTANAAACEGSTACDANINYLSLYGMIKWYPVQGKYRIWLGGGMGYLLALSKSSTALDEGAISTNQVGTAAIGTDIQMDRKNYIPVSMEYSMFPPSSTVKAHMIVIRAGFAWNL